MRAGAGYLLGAEPAQVLDPGDWVMAFPGVEARFLGSRLGGMVLGCARLRWETVAGVVSMPERRALEDLIRRPGPPKRLPAGGDLSRLLAAAVAESRPRSEFLRLCILLHCCAESVDERLVAAADRPRPMYEAMDRFARLLSGMLEDELLAKRIEDLARECGCSVRHFNRIFRRHFGLSLHQKVLQLRVEKAKRLLLDSDAKIADIAAESGMSNLGAFNTLFRRVCATTPSEWRRQNLDHPARTRPYSQP